MNRVTTHLRGNLVGWIALFVALGGTGYAAISIPRNSVGAAQIRNRSITPVKLNPSAIGGSVRAWAIIRANATVLASSGKPVVFSSVVPGSYIIQWPVRLPRTCATVATVDQRSRIRPRSRFPTAEVRTWWSVMSATPSLRQSPPEADASSRRPGSTRSIKAANPLRWPSTSR